MLKVSNLKAKVEDKAILHGVDLRVDAGEVVAVMGPNGSGKSTLAYLIAGHPKYQIQNSKFKIQNVIEVDGVDITYATPDERANRGVYLANQYPVAIPGLTVTSFLRQLYKKHNPEAAKMLSVVDFRTFITAQAKALDLNPELLSRGLNDGFSGGEKKKLEILQLLVSNPKYVILDEIDSGLDVDALKKIAKTMAKVAKERKIGILVITHYNRILKYLVPDRVVVLEGGVIKQEGTKKLAEKIEVSGYSND